MIASLLKCFHCCDNNITARIKDCCWDTIRSQMKVSLSFNIMLLTSLLLAGSRNPFMEPQLFSKRGLFTKVLAAESTWLTFWWQASRIKTRLPLACAPRFLPRRTHCYRSCLPLSWGDLSFRPLHSTHTHGAKTRAPPPPAIPWPPPGSRGATPLMDG